MKKLLLILLIALNVASVSAQKKPVNSNAKQPVLVKKISPVIKQPKYPDMIVTALSVQKNNLGYVVNYTLKNAGNAPVKKGLLSLQGYINTTNNPCGGGKLPIPLSAQEELLNPGESISGQEHISYNLSNGQSYMYILSVMGAMKVAAGTPNEKWVCSINSFQESDITNNQAQISFVAQ